MEPTQKLELKVTGLLEELSKRDDRIADLRVELTQHNQLLKALNEEVLSLREEKRVWEEASAESATEDSNDSN